MPAKTTLFDQCVHMLHNIGSAPHNFIAFNPQGRLIALARFGNLAGKMDVLDRKTLTKAIEELYQASRQPTPINSALSSGNFLRLLLPRKGSDTWSSGSVPESPRRNGKGGYAGGGGVGGSAVRSGVTTAVVEEKVPVKPATPMPGVDVALDTVAKKMRKLNKLKAIEELKEKAKCEERLEAAQMRKMEGEAEIKKELASLGSS
ncbi:hypothetical protein BDQ17DRAFT_1334098 [Cyathus striatus]|nr:hypothetical protein BDQ17DRAFT_1334098 [Cyathus striatus]